MALNNIEQLLEKYDNAETSLAEEAQIRAYFAQEEVPAHLESYKLLFQYVSHTKQEQFTKDVPLQPKRTKVYQWISVAAVAVLMLGAYFQVTQMNQTKTLDDLSHEQLMAYNQTMEVFNLVSTKLNKGSAHLGALDLVSTKLNEGAENLVYVKEFNKATNKIIKNK
ncbi:hypothetical protein [Gelidibacter gilvus]|uniref:Uncharacterized protein n=1 Tax=Gelidibacter gilvus TaxID=59602 RepID=A0A4Q0XJG3_9FLAO|nr:hypothetical protein [Gelidibacter gilvus]RXJ50145.1 hypothetical protein ESZ48_09165 [Gelidibacter gilvus]